MGLPLQHECDPDNPDEAFVWAFVALPGPGNGPLLVPPRILGQWSRRLWELGFRHHPAEQTLEYQLGGNDGHWLGQPGAWVPKGTAVAPDDGVPDVSELSAVQRAHLVAQLQQSGELAHLVDARTLAPDTARAGTAATTTPPTEGDQR
ncbi:MULTISPECIES: DUF2744 domain-containing protein [unclassified Nocardia]|uniref:phage gene 29 protein family protein n=1 Tax=unclassified Nocardia TaxID=2637762 RepID=UPI00278BB510|nr:MULTISPECIES: DUF2744 domain-containing protein [unclassified Nocardia]